MSPWVLIPIKRPDSEGHPFIRLARQIAEEDAAPSIFSNTSY